MFARGTWMFATPPLLVGILSAIFLKLYTNAWTLFFALIGFALFAFILFFFRDPERRIGEGVVSPADGKVMAVERGGGFWRVTIFMNVNDIHVNRAPLDCKVISMQRKGKGHAPAFSERTDNNVRLEWQMASHIGELKLHQVTGIFATRIVPFVAEGAILKKGDRLGMIRFGSRVEVWLPVDKFAPKVEKGTKVRAGCSTIGLLTNAEGA